jgi:hypothetical protein
MVLSGPPDSVRVRDGTEGKNFLDSLLDHVVGPS